MDIKNETRGHIYRQVADSITYGRTAVGFVVAANTVSGDRLLPQKLRHRSVGLMLGVGLLGAFDKLDGILARKAEKNGVAITRADKEKDPIEDKKFNRYMMGAIAAREFASGISKRKPTRIVFSGLVAANLLATEDRDARMAESRANAVEGADTSAIKANKFKTGLQNVGHFMASSPLAGMRFGQVLTGTVYSASTFLGEVGFGEADKIHKGAGQAKAIKPIPIVDRVFGQ